MDRNHAALFRVCRFWSGLFGVAVVSVVLCPGVGGGFGGEQLLLELISGPTSPAHPAIQFSFGLFGFCVVWFGLLVGVVQNAAGEDRTPDLRIMRPTRCKLRYCRMCLHCGGGLRCRWLVASVVLLQCVGYRGPAVLRNRPRGVAVGTLDSESDDRGPFPRGVARWFGYTWCVVWMVPRRLFARILRVVRWFAVTGGVSKTRTSWCNG